MAATVAGVAGIHQKALEARSQTQADAMVALAYVGAATASYLMAEEPQEFLSEASSCC